MSFAVASNVDEDDKKEESKRFDYSDLLKGIDLNDLPEQFSYDEQETTTPVKTSDTKEDDDGDQYLTKEQKENREAETETGGAFKAAKEWTANTTSEAGRIIFQEIGADYLGLLSHEGGFGKGDMYWNQFVDPNNWRHNPEYKGMDGLPVEKDQTWLRLKNGDVYSLTTGLKYPSHLLPENVDNILKDESLLSQIGNAAIGRNWTTERKSKEELTQLMNTKGSGATLVQHPALTRVEAIKKALTEHNEKNPNNTLGPTGDYGATQNRQLAGVAKYFGNTVDEEGGITWEQGELEHGEGIVGGFLGYGIPIALLAWANNRAFGSSLKPFSARLNVAAHGPNAARVFANPLKSGYWTKAGFVARSKTAGARILKGSTDFALESALVSRAAESEVSTFPTNELFGLDPSDEINFEAKHGRKMTNEDRRILNMKRDMFVYGPILGNLGEFGGPLTKAFRGSIRNIPANLQKLPGRVNKKVDELSEKTADVIADIVFENKLRANEQKAIELAKEGPSPEVKNDQVIPTERVTGTKKTEPEEIIKPKGTQRELDLQVKEATEAKIKAEKQTDKTAKVLLDSAQAVKPEELEGPRTLAEELEGINPDKLTKKELLEYIRRLGNEATDKELESIGITRQQIEDIPRSPEVDEKQARGRKKIQPGEPHPTDKNKVRGYNGRWVTKAYFDKVTKSRAGAEKIKKGIFDKEKKQIKDLGESIKKAQETVDSQKTLEEIEADAQKKVDSMTAEEIKESLRANPKYKDLIDEMDALEKSHTENLKNAKDALKNIDELLRESDEIMDSLDEQIFQLNPTDEARIRLEKAYEGVDAVRRDLKLEKKAQIEGVPDEIGGKSEPIESPLIERPTFGFEIKGAKPSYRQMSIEFESDVDRAIYIVTKRRTGSGPAKSRPLYVEQSNHNPSKANHKYLAFLFDLGFDDALILKHAPKIYDTLAKNYSANSVYNLKDTNAWKAGSDWDLEMEDPRFYDPERGLDDVVEEQGREWVRRYKELTDPKDPNTAENLLREDDLELDLPILPRKGNKGKSVEDILIQKGISPMQVEWDTAMGISLEGWQKIEDAIFRIAGSDVNLDFTRELTSRYTAQNVANYGHDPSLVGRKKKSTVARYDTKKDLITVSMISSGRYVEYSLGLNAAYHESFHRLQRKFLTKAELKVLHNAAPKLRQLIREAYPELAETKLKGLKDIELQAWAFGAWSRTDIRSKYKKGTTWAQPLEKMAEIIRAVLNVFSDEHTTWNELFEAARKGEIAERGPRNGGFAVQTDEGLILEMDPDDFIDGMKKRGEELANGERSIEDVMGETIEGGNDPAEMSRRLRSRSGKTEYIPRDQEDIIKGNSVFNDILQTAVGDRAAATGIRSINLAQIKQLGKKNVIDLGLDPKETIVYYERARQGDLRSQDDLVGLAGLIWHRDVNLQTLTENAISYEGALGAEQVKAGQRLLASMEDQLKLDIALQSISRKWGQSGKVLQQGFGDFMAQSLDEGTVLRQTVSKEFAETKLKSGFKGMEDGPAGKGAYFSTKETPGPAGSVELYGDVKEDLLVLDLVSSYKTLDDIAKIVNPKFKGKITANDKKLIEAFIREKGYIGIRYPDGKTGDKVVLYSENAANRIIDSDAAIPPERSDNQPVKSLIQTALDGVENILTKKLDPRVAESLERGQMTSEAKQVLDGLSAVSYALNDGKKAGVNLLKLVDKVPDGKLNRDTVWNLFRNLIFLRASTFMKVFGGSQYRTLTMPINIALGELSSRKGMSPARIEQSKRRVEMAWQMYPKMFRQLPYAFEMMWAAMRHNEALVNLGRGTFEGSTNRYIGGNKQLEFDFEGQALTKELTGKEWWLDGHNNPLSIANHYIGEFLKTGSSRIMAGFDSFHAGMVGPTTEYFRFYDLEIEKLHNKGIEGPRAHNEAHETAMKRVEKAMQNIDLADGRVIKNGRLTGSHAKKAMDWVNFTDDIRIAKGGKSPIENRTYEYGVEKAREEGLTDAREILEYATEWTNQVPGQDYGQLGEIGMPFGMKSQEIQRGLMSVTNSPGYLWQQIMNTLPAFAYPAQAVNRTPANIGKSAQRAIPGLNKYVDSYWRDIHSEDWITRSRALGEVSTAQVILGMGITMAGTGLIKINGFRPFDQAQRQEWLETGREPLTIQILNPFTGKYTGGIPLDMLDGPANIWAAIGTYTTNYQQLRQKDQEAFFAFTAWGAIAPTLRQTIFGQTDRGGFGGFKKLMTLLSELGSGGLDQEIKGNQGAFERYVIGVLTGSGFLGGPGFVKDMRNAIDPIQRDIDVSRIDTPFDDNLPIDSILRVFENTINTWKNGIPYLSQQNPPVLHTFTGQPVQVRRVPFDDGIPADNPLLKIANSQSPLAAFKGRLPSGRTEYEGPLKKDSEDYVVSVDEERIRLQGPGANANFVVWKRRMFNLPDRVLNRTEINQVTTIGTSIRLVYPPLPGRSQKKGTDAFGRGLLNAIESETGLTLEEALTKMINSKKYKAASADPKGNNRSEKSEMWWEIIDIYKAFAKDKFMYQSDQGPGTIGDAIKKKLKQDQKKANDQRVSYDRYNPTASEFVNFVA